jgi:hypothetical protein
MFSRNVSVLAGSLLMAVSTWAQAPLLLDPSQAPITLKGGWEQKKGVAGSSANRGDIAVKISKINPDGTFEGTLDFFSPGRWCHAVNEPIKEGKLTAKGLSLIASGGPATVCGMMTLEFHRGKDKYLQGRVKSEAEAHGAPMWLDAPK